MIFDTICVFYKISKCIERQPGFANLMQRTHHVSYLIIQEGIAFKVKMNKQTSACIFNFFYIFY